MHDVRYDAIHDEFLVTNPFAQAVLVFRGGANGEEAPIRVIQGPRTQIGVGSPYSGVDRAEVDPIHNEIYVPIYNAILVFPREANGDVAPIRVIRGPDTQLNGSNVAAVDPVNNLLVVTARVVLPGTRGRGGNAEDDRRMPGMLIFNRTDSGNVKPRAVIAGPSTAIDRIQQIQVYPPKGWIVASMPGEGGKIEPDRVFIGIWSIRDNGDIPPRWKLGGPNTTMKKPRGVALDPKHKELIVADMRLNMVLTFYFPELF